MSFVFPALLGTLIAAGIPVALHLMMRPKPRTLPFPAFRFLVAKQRANQRSLRLRHLLLLLLRIVLIAGLILAVARPRLFQQNLGLSTERPVFAVFVFDTSPSMEYKSADQRTRLDDAKKRADELLTELPAGSRIAIRTSNDRLGERIEATANLTDARKRIQSMEIAAAGPPLSAALIAGLKDLADVARKSEDETARKLPRLLCVFSDTTRGSWDPAQTAAVEAASDLVPPTRESLLAAQAELANLLTLRKETPDKFAGIADFDKNLQFLSERIPRLGPADFPLQTEPADLVRQARRSIRDALRLLPAAEPSSEDKESARWEDALRKTLHSLSGQETLWFDVGMNPLSDLAIVRIDWPQRGGEPIETFAPDEDVPLRVVVEAAGQGVQTTLTCEHPTGKLTQSIELEAGKTETVEFKLPLAELKLGPGGHSVTLSLDVRDGWIGNNRRFATFQVREPKKILVVSDRPEVEHELQHALRANRFDVETRKPDAVEPALLAGFDAVYLFGVAQPSANLWKALDGYVKSGGGLGVVPGDQSMDPKAYGTPLALSLLPGKFDVVEYVGDRKKEIGETWSFEPETIFRHPILKPFDGWRREETHGLVSSPPMTWTLWRVAAMPGHAGSATRTAMPAAPREDRRRRQGPSVHDDARSPGRSQIALEQLPGEVVLRRPRRSDREASGRRIGGGLVQLHDARRGAGRLGPRLGRQARRADRARQARPDHGSRRHGPVGDSAGDDSGKLPHRGRRRQDAARRLQRQPDVRRGRAGPARKRDDRERLRRRRHRARRSTGGSSATPPGPLA